MMESGELLDVTKLPRRTKIVATLGPSTNTPECIRGLLAAGVDVVRLNFSHGTPEEHGRVARIVREIAQEVGRTIAIMQDLQGPKVRVGEFPDGTVYLPTGTTVTLTTRAIPGSLEVIPILYPSLPQDVKPGHRILLDDGNLELVVESCEEEAVRCRVTRGGPLSSHKGVNFPDTHLRLPSLTEKDVSDLEFGLGMGVDYVALSFVRKAEDILQVRRLTRSLGAPDVRLIAKLERAEAIENLEEIVEAADGVMVARGDLGVELDPERIPILQKVIIRKANQVGIPVITATQMLESMVHHPRPTRAETSDVANAILDGTDAVMLSAETATGNYPIEAVRMMDRIARAVEASPEYRYGRRADPQRVTHAFAVGQAACHLAEELDVKALVVITRSGRTAEMISTNRPRQPLIAFTESPTVARRLSMWWGVQPVQTAFQRDTDSMITHVEGELVARGLVKPGDTIVLVGSAPIIARGRTNFIKLHRVRGHRAAAAQEEHPAQL